MSMSEWVLDGLCPATCHSDVRLHLGEQREKPLESRRARRDLGEGGRVEAALRVLGQAGKPICEHLRGHESGVVTAATAATQNYPADKVPALSPQNVGWRVEAKLAMRPGAAPCPPDGLLRAGRDQR